MGRTVSLTKPAKKRVSGRAPKKAALEADTAPRTRGEEIADRVKRLHDVNAQKKALEKEEAALKEWFRCEASGADAVYEFMDQEVLVTGKQRTSIDSEKLRAELGEDVARFEKTTQYVEVSCRTKAAA